MHSRGQWKALLEMGLGERPIIVLDSAGQRGLVWVLWLLVITGKAQSLRIMWVPLGRADGWRRERVHAGSEK